MRLSMRLVWRAAIRSIEFPQRSVRRSGDGVRRGAARAEARAGGRLRFAAAVAAKRRLPCAARPAVASQNSLRSLRSLRSNSRDESDDEARASARRPRVCAARRRSRRCACRPPAPLREPAVDFSWGAHRGSSQSRGRVAGRAPLRRRGAQGLGGCASPQGEASSAACLSTEHRQPAQQDAARARASSALAPGHRAPQGSRRCAPTAAVKHARPPAHGFATLRPDRRVC